MIELTNAKQRKEELVTYVINRWRNLSLNCKDLLCEASAIDMCIQGIHWDLQYILQGIKPMSFDDFATRAHDMELSIAMHKNNNSIAQDVRRTKDKFEIKKGGNISTKDDDK
ncbi:hypothetical protein LIER_24835 [Lithospermum erythrorhizon]|uniref:Uncharacterized protein n=1 Tax=Lithospermum erythrorhizon TaxID=34254 RepID=A0AAV3R5M1_LITER